MSTTLTYGLKRPVDGDQGATLFDDLEGDITQLDAHNHNGTNSSKLSPSAMDVTAVTVAAANWNAGSYGNYYQEVTIAGSLTFETMHCSVYVNGGTNDGQIIFPTIKKGSSSSTIYIYVNDNTLALKVIFR